MKSKLFTLVMILLSTILTSAYGAIIVTIEEVGPNVVASFTGSFNTAATVAPTGGGPSKGIIASDDGSFNSLYIAIGSGTSTEAFFIEATGPTDFGTDTSYQSASSSTGDLFTFFPFINSGQPELEFKSGYVSGSQTSGSSTFSGETITSMGLTPGTYNWTVGNTGFTITDTVSLNVVPEPATLGLLGMVGIGLIVIRRIRL